MEFFFYVGFMCTNGSKPNKQLLYATEVGWLDRVKQIMECNMTDVNTKDDESRSPLYLAASNNHSNLVNFLLQQESIDINQANKEDGGTALLVAAQYGYSDIVRLLTNNDRTDINKELPDTGLTPLIIASMNGHKSVVEILLAHPAILVNKGLHTSGVTALVAAVKNEHYPVVELLLKFQQIDVNQGQKNGKSPLIVASNSTSSLGVEMLLAKPGIKVNTALFDGQTALFFAVGRKHHKIIELLLRCPKVNTDLVDDEYKTALTYATETNQKSIIDAFENRGFLTTKEGHSCCSNNINRGLHIAAEKNDVTWVKTFLKCTHINPNLGDQYGNTPLITAAREGFTEIAELLLNDHNINANKYNSVNGKTALIVASEEGKWEIVKLLLSNPQINVEISDIFGNTALNKAATNKHITAVKLLLRCSKTKVHNNVDKSDPHIAETIKSRNILLKRGPTCCLNISDGLLEAANKGFYLEIRGLLQCPESNSNVIDKKGRTPLYLASWKGHDMAVQELLEDPNLDINRGVDMGGGTAFSIASEKRHFMVLKLLIIHINNDENIALSKGWCEENWTPTITFCTKPKLDDASASTSEMTSPHTGEYIINLFFVDEPTNIVSSQMVKIVMWISSTVK